jgi:hypothetical protein
MVELLAGEGLWVGWVGQKHGWAGWGRNMGGLGGEETWVGWVGQKPGWEGRERNRNSHRWDAVQASCRGELQLDRTVGQAQRGGAVGFVAQEVAAELV